MIQKEISWYQGKLYTSSVKIIFDSVLFSASYSKWKERFIYIHGAFDTQRKIDIQKLEKTFDVTLGTEQEELFKLVYSLETYYSIILRIIAHKAIFSECQNIHCIFDDNTYISAGILNYTCVSYYNWFLTSPNVEKIVSKIYAAVSLQDIESKGDVISVIFEYIFPKEIRHSVGEYYTPYWLANKVVDEVTNGDEEAFSKKFIDPACGSATFIVVLINKYRKSSNNLIFSNVCGIDINPLTVLAAKTNYLLLYSKYCGINVSTPLEIPIYNADTLAINNCLTLFPEEHDYDPVPRIKYDYIVGNPPWVNWEYMPDNYRMQHAKLWQHYGLFSQKGLNSNFIKEDISVLMTYVVIDNYLANGGKIGFVVKETLFKSIKQGEGFRKFRIIPQNIDLKVLRVDDLTQIKPFKDAVTRTAILYIEKGDKTNYPVDYIVWKPLKKIKSFECNEIFELSDYIKFETLKARPSINSVINSGWITESEHEMNYSKHILGNNGLVARTGVFTGGANGIYWLNIDADQGNNVLVSNITERAKNKMKKVQFTVEKKFVFPFLTGNELDFWSYNYSKYILCPHTYVSKMYPIDTTELAKYPLTEKYFWEFKKELEERKGFTSMDESIHEQFFYTLQRIGVYTFARYKVCWRYISKNFTPAVVEVAIDKYLGEKVIIGNEKIISIPFDNREEAYYVCAVISSTPYRKTIDNYMVGTQITPSIISRLNIPQFDGQNPQHLELSRLCREGHFTNGEKTSYVKQIDEIIEQWVN
ncbi:MAG: SAM-dependent methyltransferase [Bacteroidales bacterium]|nr:SAM-dependent methyltransferase [Bacteroidales bacterium]